MGIIHSDHQGLCPLVPYFLLYLVHYEYGIPLKMIHIDIPLSGLITSMFLAMNVSSLWQYDLEFSVPPLSFPAWAENPDPAAQHACSSTSPSLLLRVEKDRESEGRKGCCRLHVLLIKHSPNWGQSLIREGDHEEKWIWRLLSFLSFFFILFLLQRLITCTCSPGLLIFCHANGYSLTCQPWHHHCYYFYSGFSHGGTSHRLFYM